MARSNELYNLARARVDRSRTLAELDAKDRLNNYLAANPEYAHLRSERARAGADLAKRIFRGGSGSAEIEDIKRRNLDVQRRMAEYLSRDGLTEDYFEPDYSCKACSDSGVLNGQLCTCMAKMMRQAAYERLNATTPLSLSTFDSFKLDYYSDVPDENGRIPRKEMGRLLERSKQYAESFSAQSPSLLFQGGVGLGKTHLSLAIAGEVIEQGFDVVYGSAHSLFTKLEREKFGKDDEREDTLGCLNECDLLIIDDLGAEFTTTFTTSIFYDIINTRLLSSRPTIISTNMNFDGMTQKYSERIVSRITGSYLRFMFIGSDLRIHKRRAGRNGS